MQVSASTLDQIQPTSHCVHRKASWHDTALGCCCCSKEGKGSSHTCASADAMAGTAWEADSRVMDGCGTLAAGGADAGAPSTAS